MVPDLLIVGGGVIGLCLADCALREGLRILLIDKGPVAQEASWAGAGMLTCRPRCRHHTEAEGAAQPDYHDLTGLSVQLYPKWSERLLAETGIDIGYRVCGALEFVMHGPGAQSHTQDLSALVATCNARGVNARELSTAQACVLEPALSPEIASAAEFPDEAQVRSPWFTRALCANVTRLGGEIRQGEEAADIDLAIDTDSKRRRVQGIVLRNGQKLFAGAVAVCAGAWTGYFPSLAQVAPRSTKIKPVRGQMLRYQIAPDLTLSVAPASNRLSGRLLTCKNQYVVPRGDGVLLVGATHENAGFNKTVTSEGCLELEEFARAAVPELKRHRPLQRWAGLRPGLKGRHPMLGSVKDIHGLFIAAGHYRNGFTLAPVSAEVIVDMLLGRNPRISLATWMES